MKTYDEWLEEVKHYGWALVYVPKEHRDYAMCLTAVKQDGWLLKHVPELLQAKVKQELGL